MGIGYDPRRRAYYGVTTFTENGKRIYRRVYGETKTEAKTKLEELKVALRRGEAKPKEITFATLAEDFAAHRLIEARYVGEKKIAGRRELTAPRAWLARLTAHFGKRKVSEIRPKDLEAYKLTLSDLPNQRGEQRSIAAINRELEFLRTVFNHAVANGWLAKNPFSLAKKLIEKSHETKRDRLLGFGEELALLNACYRPNARNSERGNEQLRAILICAADTGLRRNELFTLEWADLDFAKRTINLRAINAKNNQARQIPMTPRVCELLEPYQGNGLIFGLTDIKRSFATAKRLAGIVDLHLHDLRHAFITRAVLAGVPIAMVTAASGHLSDEYKRYVNVGPDALRQLLATMPGQTVEEVRAYARDVMRGLREALHYDEIEALLR